VIYAGTPQTITIYERGAPVRSGARLVPAAETSRAVVASVQGVPADRMAVLDDQIRALPLRSIVYEGPAAPPRPQQRVAAGQVAGVPAAEIDLGDGRRWRVVDLQDCPPNGPMAAVWQVVIALPVSGEAP
jgi:hypothetical protein